MGRLRKVLQQSVSQDPGLWHLLSYILVLGLRASHFTSQSLCVITCKPGAWDHLARPGGLALALLSGAGTPFLSSHCKDVCISEMELLSNLK